MIKKSVNFLEEIVDINLKDRKSPDISLIIVSHFLPDKVDFIDVLSKHFKIEFIIPKPNSIDKNVFEVLSKKYEIFQMTREDIFINKEVVLERLQEIKNQIIIIDIGGYFAQTINFLEEHLEDRIIGIIEDTENGHQKYEKFNNTKIPILSVARSILKESEDFLVGQSVVFSTDYVLRLNNTLLNNKYAVIIGFGKIGKSIASDLRGKNIQLGIYDTDPYKGIEALTYGYDFLEKDEALCRADIIFCATGNFSLTAEDYIVLKDGAILSSVTSSDDELDVDFLEKEYEKEIINRYTSKYTSNGKRIFLLNEGNSINFINNAVVGEFIYLIQAEIVHILFQLKYGLGKNSKTIKVIENSDKSYIAKIWLDYFNF